MSRRIFSLDPDAAGGLLLLLAAALAIFLDNSAFAPLYDALLATPFSVRLGEAGLDKPLLLWINDGLMALFFVLVGLEIKREILVGRLSSPRRAALPVIAAVGGMGAPALVFVLFNLGSPENLGGWAIPTATDIAFAIGVLALLGPRVPPGLKIFLMALAVIDDLGAIVIIALFYTAGLSTVALSVAAACIVLLAALNRLHVTRLTPYALVGAVLWVAVLKSGVHATLAGVVVALAIPARGHAPEDPSPLERLEHRLHGWVNFFIMPVFAFANAGVPLAGVGLADLLSPLTLGIGLGLFLGKQAGVMGASWLAVRTGLAGLPEGVTWRAMYGVSLITGIGFTMSLFIGMLAFADPAHAGAVRMGVLGGSFASAALGFAWLRLLPVRRTGAAPAE
ncbi:Na+/H+ antiporter NhaA [Oleispirillum naphthae]|uniref:Na+/H+ antiporter NhaA n=1 Tax=Oleispirillum naphthae TaxID=2838853 RepID=UPI003082628B